MRLCAARHRRASHRAGERPRRLRDFRAYGMLSRDGPRSASRRALRALADRAQDAAQPLLPGASLHGFRLREAVVAGASPRRQGRRRVGCRQHGVLRDHTGVRRDALRVGPHVGRARRAGARRDLRRGAQARRPRGHRALAHGRARREQRVTAGRGGALADRERLRSRARAPGDDEARHPPGSGRLGARGRQSRSAGFDIVYVYGAHTYLPGQFLSPHYNRRGTSTAARSPIARASGSRRSTSCAARSATIVRSPAAWPSIGGARWASTSRKCSIRPHGRSPRRPLGRHGRLDRRVVEDSGPSRFFAEGWQLDSTARVREATIKPIVGVSRLTDPDLMAEILRSGAWDLSARPAIDCRSLPPTQDRRGPSRRDSRVHRLQRLHLQGRHAPPHRLHAERDGGRRAPERLAPGALRAVARRLRRARRGWRAGRHGVRADARAARSGSRAPRRPLPVDGRAPRLAHPAAGHCRVGPPDGLSHGRAQATAERRADQRDRADRGGDRA